MEQQNKNQNQNNITTEDLNLQEETTEIIEQPKKEVKKEKIEDRHKQVDPCTYGDRIDVEKGNLPKPGSVFVPTIGYAAAELLNSKFAKNKKYDSLSLNERYITYLHFLNGGNDEIARTVVKDGMLDKPLNDNPGNFVNEVNYSDRSLVPSVIGFKEPTNKNISGSNAIAIFRSMTASGNVIHVPLWHSGFWVVLKPPTQAEIVNLQMSLANNEISLGRDIYSVIYSNYAAVYNRIVSEFIVGHINTTSLKLGPDDDIRDYISIHDYFPLVAGLLSTMYPEGLDMIKACANGSVLDEDDRPTCDFILQGKIDAKKITWVDRTKLNSYMLSHMSNRTTNSMEKVSVEEYKKYVSSLMDREYEIEFSNGKKIKVSFHNPSLKENVTQGEEWVQYVISQTENTFLADDTAEQKDAKVYTLAKSIVLCIYNTYVKSFKIDDMIIEDRSTFNTILGDITVDDKAAEGFINAIKDYIDVSPIAIVAVPSWTCPKCNKDQSTINGPFKGFIPINVVVHFFDQCGFRAQKIQ